VTQLEAPSPGVVELWALDPSALTAQAWAQLRTGLTATELAEAEGRASELSARELLAARALLRHALAAYVDIAPSLLRFEADLNGKPRLASHRKPALEFSVAHTPGLVLCGIASAPLGVDTEHTARTEPSAVAGRYFTTAERAALAAHGGARTEHFFKYWTIKEAVLKATGVGISELTRVECRFRGSELELSFPERGAVGAWSVEAWRATPRHQVAVALSGWQARLSVRLRDRGAWGMFLGEPESSPVELRATNQLA
jgi:4'-phosphopantetheinyl transferase